MHEHEFRPTHVTPRDGLPAWSDTDQGQEQPSAWLDPLLPVEVVDRSGDWCRIRCSNGWAAWVDGRPLVAVPDEPPSTGLPLGRTGDPRPLLTRVEQAVDAYRRALEELGTGRTDGEAFHTRTRGVRTGVIVDGSEVWLFDADHDRWCYCDGSALEAYATVEEPPATKSTAAQQATRTDGGAR